MKSAGKSSRAEHLAVGVLGSLLLFGLPACDSGGGAKPAGDAAVPRAEVAEGGQETARARDGAGMIGDTADTGASAIADGGEGQGDTTGRDATDANGDGAAADRWPDLAGDPDAVDGPTGIDANADGDDDIAVATAPDLMTIDAGHDAAASADGLVAVGDAPIGMDATADIPPDGTIDSAANQGNRDAGGAGDGRGNEALDGGGIDGGACCGCLCRDPAWSCSRDTCLDSAGRAIGLAAEAGFFELTGGPYVVENQNRISPTHRVWYSFHPAAAEPESKPLAVFFNGGPGSATSAHLFCFNTAPHTLDPAFTSTGQIASNASSWTQFANLLYIDAPATGFSYPLPLADGTKPSVGIDIDRDAAAFVRVVVRFLARHPALRGNRVVLVGESYGGTRATLMLSYLYQYQMLTAADAFYQDRDLYGDLVQHFTSVFPGEDATKLPAATIASQFGHQVLIQPVVAGDNQWKHQHPDISVCVDGFDIYQCDEVQGWTDVATAQAAANLAKLANLRQALGVDPTTIEWLHARARTKAYSRWSSNVVSTPELTTVFGQLGDEDNYFLTLNESVLMGYTGARSWHDSNIGETFLADLTYAETLITDAKLDIVIASPAIAPALSLYTSVVKGATLDAAPRDGVLRPGWIKVDYLATVMSGETSREIRFPHYAAAGHMVTVRDSAELLADVRQWYASSLAAARAAAAPVPPAAAQIVTPSQPRESSPGWSERDLYLGP